MKPIVGVDIDGVLADWNNAFRQVLINRTGRVLMDLDFDPPVWNYAEHYGYTAEETARAYADIHTDSFFWQNLKPLPGAERLAGVLDRLEWEDRIELYFVTARSGVDVKFQTERWLGHLMGHPRLRSTVLICPGDKADVATALRMTHFIDDKFETALAMARAGLWSFLPKRAYNRQANAHPNIIQLEPGDFTPFLLALAPAPIGMAA